MRTAQLPKSNATFPGCAKASKLLREDGQITVRGNLVLTGNVRFAKNLTLVVEGNVLSRGKQKYLLSVRGDLRVGGNVSCSRLRVGGRAEIAGNLTARKVSTHSLEAADISARRLNGWHVVGRNIRIESGGKANFISCETIEYGKKLQFYRIVKNFSKYAPNDGAATADDVILSIRPRT